ncbi:MAG TPA: nuclear transport factor 2 family protein [Solirubrobacterales bacterium]|nr:nuclear transport factor 2 family protein [Solirubrobacterales bacterium]
MPEQDLDVLTRLYAAFNDRDMPGMLECMDPAMEVSAPEGLEYAAVMMRLLGPRGVVLLDKYSGHDEVRRLYEALWTISARFTVDPVDFIREEGGVIVPARLRATTADAGTEGEVQVAHLWTLAGDKVTSLRIFVDMDRAKTALRAGREEGEE